MSSNSYNPFSICEIINAPNIVLEVLRIIIGVDEVIFSSEEAIPSAPVHNLVPSKTAALTPDF